MNLKEYQKLARRTMRKSVPKEDRRELSIAGLGLAGESGEVIELLKKYIGHGHLLDLDRVEKELGDVLWYLSAIATLCNLNLDYIAKLNIDKLRERYPEGFSEERSRNRGEK